MHNSNHICSQINPYKRPNVYPNSDSREVVESIIFDDYNLIQADKVPMDKTGRRTNDQPERLFRIDPDHNPVE